MLVNHHPLLLTVTTLVFLLIPEKIKSFQSPPRKKFSSVQYNNRSSLTTTTTTTSSSSSSSIANINIPPQQVECNKKLTSGSTDANNGLNVRIHGVWYDLLDWRKAHPAGQHWIDMYNGRDATEVMDAFHSDKAQRMYQKLKRTDEDTAAVLDMSTPADTDVTLAFRKFRSKLVGQGWFERDSFHEAKLLAINFAVFVGAAVTAHSAPFLSMTLLSLAYTNAGWIGHDYVHGTDNFSERLRIFTPLVAGLGFTWWSDKHNLHHAATNEMGVDGDMAIGPLLYTYAPDPSKDSLFRKIQHVTFIPIFSLLKWLWTFRSFEIVVKAIEEKRPQAKKELYCLMVHFLLLLSVFPLQVWVPAFFLSGLLTALIVTPTHQNDAFFSNTQIDWVTAQFQSTRNAVLTNPFSTWLWGGMQYQLEHHLFPAMPRSKYPQLRPLLKEFAAEHGLKYLESGEFELLRINWELYRDVSKASPVPGAPHGALQSASDKIFGEIGVR